MTKRFNPAPGWPEAPDGWLPFDGWEPDAAWPPAPPGWPLIVDVSTPLGESRLVQKMMQAGKDLQSRVTAPADDAANGPDVLWSAKGQPIAGVGGGRYRLTARTLYFERGLVTTNAQQVPTNQLFDIDMRQSLTQKARGVGDVIVHINRNGAVETAILRDIPDARSAVSLINDVAHQARLETARVNNTRHYSAERSQSTETAPDAPAAAIKQLKELGQLRDAGILTEEEFASKKTDILSRM